MQEILKSRALLVILLTALGFIVYANSVNSSFMWDDSALIRDNTYIKNFSNIPKVFTHDIAAGALKKSNSYRPLQMLSYMLDYFFFRLDPRGYHLVNLILHILAGLSLFWLINTIYKDKILSFIAAALFLVHPIHTEAVSYISGRADSLAGVFLFLSLGFYVRYIDSKRIGPCIMMLFSLALALLSRENTLVFPLLILLFHFSFRKRPDAKCLISIAVVIVLYIFLRLYALKALVPYPPAAGTFFGRLPGFFVALTDYMRLLFLPFGLHMEYGFKFFKPAHPKAIIGILMLAVALYAVFKRREAGEGILSFSILWFFITLLPSSNLFPVNAYMAEHWLYIPSVGFFLAAAAFLRNLLRREGARPLAAGIIGGLILFYSMLTINQNTYWREPLPFYKRTLRYAPDSARAYYNLAYLYERRGAYDEAVGLFEEAIRLNPEYVNAYNHFGILYYDTGEYKKAIELYKKAIDIDPGFADAYNNLGNAYCALGRYKESIPLYEKALELNPYYAYAYNNLGLAYFDLGENEKAMGLFTKAIDLHPDYAYAYNNMGMVYYDYRDYREAIKYFKKSLELDEEYAIAHFNISLAYFRVEEYGLSVTHCNRAIELGHKVDPTFLEIIAPYRNKGQEAE